MTTEAMIDRATILAAAETIEPLPASVSRLLSIVSDADYSHKDIIDVIRFDPALTADLLRRANSVVYAARSMVITNVRDAVSRLGTSTVISTAVARMMREQMSEDLPAYGLDANALWNHSMAASVCAECIRMRNATLLPPHAGTAALLHDIGKVIIAGCFSPGIVDALVTAAETEHRPIQQVEQEVLGIDHAEVSGLAARAWGLPVSVQIALTRHHDLDGVDDVLTHLVAVADTMAHCIQDISAEDVEELELDLDPVQALDESLERLGLAEREVPIVAISAVHDFVSVRAGYQG